MLWTPISALAAGVAIVGTAGSVIAVKQGLPSQQIRSPRAEQAMLLSKDVARLPAGLPEIAAEVPAQTLVDETTLFAFPPSVSVEQAAEVRPEANIVEAAIPVPLPAPRIAPPTPRITPPTPRNARANFRPRIARAAQPARTSTQQPARAVAQKPAQPARAVAQKPPQQAPQAQSQSWLSRLGLTAEQPANASVKGTATVAQSVQ